VNEQQLLSTDKQFPPLIVALDFPSSAQAQLIIDQLKKTGCPFKIGKELFTAAGPAFVRGLVEQGIQIFLDLKYHDIPSTIARTCRAAADLGVWMFNVHALGGRDMLLAASEALKAYQNPPLLLAVTILTSLEDNDLYAIGLRGSAEENVLRLARLAKACGLDGVVCSPQEIASVRHAVGVDFQLVTPGIRPTNKDSKDDQKRTMTPSEALQYGANYLVIGRPITAAANPLQAFLDIQASLHL